MPIIAKQNVQFVVNVERAIPADNARAGGQSPAFSGASPASHRAERRAGQTRRAARPYRLYVTEAQRPRNAARVEFRGSVAAGRARPVIEERT
jgi:hypothetical protein